MARRSVVVDASAALKWAVAERGSAAALVLLEWDVLHAPDFILVEVANVLGAKVRRQVVGRSEADAAFEAIASVPMALTPTGELVLAARTLAFALDITLYDALYAALAQRYNCPLATADRSLAAAMNASGGPGTGLLIE